MTKSTGTQRLLADCSVNHEVDVSISSIPSLASNSVFVGQSDEVHPFWGNVSSSCYAFPPSSIPVSDAEVGSFIKCSTLSVTTTGASSFAVVTAPSEVKMVEGSSSLDRGLVTYGAKGMSGGNVRTLVDINSDHLGSIYSPEWGVTNGSRLTHPLECRDAIDSFAPPCLFGAVRGFDHDQLFSVFNTSTAHQTVLSAELRMRAKSLL